MDSHSNTLSLKSPATLPPLRIFVTGTDTDVGKTLVACGLIECANRLGLSTAAIKPIAAGCHEIGIKNETGRKNKATSLLNSDALALQKICSEPLSYSEVNPVALRMPIAPHIAAEVDGVTLDLAALNCDCLTVLKRNADITVIEGAGGWYTPLNATETLADLATKLNCGIILVVNIKLGCINHALLTARAIQAEGLTLLAWVANCSEKQSDTDFQALDTKTLVEKNITAIQNHIQAPCIGIVPYLNEASSAHVANHLNITELFKHA